MYDSKVKKPIIFKTMTNGSYFGDTDIIQRRRRNCNLVATSECDCFTLSRTVKKKLPKGI